MKKILPYILASMFAVSVVAPVGPGAMAHGWCKDRTTTFCEKRKLKKLARDVKRGKATVVERSPDGQAAAVKSSDGTVTVVQKSLTKDGKTAVAVVTTPKGTLYGYGGGGRGRGDWGRGGGGRGGGGWGRGPGAGDIAAGVIIGGAVSNWLFPPKPEVVVVQAPPPPPEGPPAWSPEWYDYCNGKYKSFDAKTGYYTGYDGQQHFCQ